MPRPPVACDALRIARGLFEAMRQVNDSAGVRTVDLVVPTTGTDLVACISTHAQDGPLVLKEVLADVALRVDHPPTPNERAR